MGDANLRLQVKIQQIKQIVGATLSCFFTLPEIVLDLTVSGRVNPEYSYLENGWNILLKPLRKSFAMTDSFRNFLRMKKSLSIAPSLQWAQISPWRRRKYTWKVCCQRRFPDRIKRYGIDIVRQKVKQGTRFLISLLQILNFMRNGNLIN